MSSIILEEENYVELPERYIVQGGIGKYKKVKQNVPYSLKKTVMFGPIYPFY